MHAHIRSLWVLAIRHRQIVAVCPGIPRHCSRQGPVAAAPASKRRRHVFPVHRIARWLAVAKALACLERQPSTTQCPLADRQHFAVDSVNGIVRRRNGERLRVIVLPITRALRFPRRTASRHLSSLNGSGATRVRTTREAVLKFPAVFARLQKRRPALVKSTRRTRSRLRLLASHSRIFPSALRALRAS